MQRKISSLALAASLGLAVGTFGIAVVAAQAQSSASTFPDYHLTKIISVPSSSSGWDYVAFDPTNDQLLVGHRLDSVEAFDIRHNFKMTKVPDTKGVNGVALATNLGLGIAAGKSGYLTEFRLKTLKEVKKIRAGKEVDSAAYEPVTHQVTALNATTTPDGKNETLVFYKVPSLTKTATVTMPAGDLEHSVADGKGNLYFAAQDVNTIIRLDVKTMKVTGNWPTTGCVQPTGVDLDKATNRLMIACRGKNLENAVFQVMNDETGAIVYTAPTTAGNDGVAFDPKNGEIFVANGIGANMFVFHEDSADKYRLAEIIDTSTNQRTLAIDPKTDQVYTIAAEGLVDPAKKILTKVSPFYPNVFSSNSFKIYQYGR
jgi:DNA-binding beta-propeller fold protein YncE